MADTGREEPRVEDQVPRMRTPREVADLMRRGNSFDAMLFRLLDKADRENFHKLRRAYPQQAREYVNWFHHGKVPG